jgi:hypothetical protein
MISAAEAKNIANQANQEKRQAGLEALSKGCDVADDFIETQLQGLIQACAVEGRPALRITFKDFEEYGKSITPKPLFAGEHIDKKLKETLVPLGYKVFSNASWSIIWGE